MEIKNLIVGDIDTNCYLIIDSGEMAVVDPGGDSDKILEEIKARGEKLKYIINTHYHFDHVLANEPIKKATDAKVLIHEEEIGYINHQPDRFLRDGQEIKIGDCVFNVLRTPGHTRGSFCLIGEDVIFTGDTLFKDGYGRTDLPGGSEKDMLASLEKLKTIIKPGMYVYPGHGETYRA